MLFHKNLKIRELYFYEVQHKITANMNKKGSGLSLINLWVFIGGSK